MLVLGGKVRLSWMYCTVRNGTRGGGWRIDGVIDGVVVVIEERLAD